MGRYLPIATDLEAAPKDLLNVVRCKCQTETNKPCSSNLCSCRKHGLHCVSACKNCNGECCENIGHDISNPVTEDDVHDSESSDVDDAKEEQDEGDCDDCLDFDMSFELYEEII